jgi:hypothetical protein
MSTQDDADMSADGRWLSYDQISALRRIDKPSAVKLATRNRWERRKSNAGQMQVFVPVHWFDRAQDRHDKYTDKSMFSDTLAAGASEVETVLMALREAHAREIGLLTEALAVERSRVDALMKASDGQRDQIAAAEAELAAEKVRAEAARNRANELANGVMTLEVAAEQAREAAKAAEGQTEAERVRADDEATRAGGLDRLLADAEHRLTEAEQGRATAQERLDAMDRAEVARRGKGRWARLRAAWRGE